MGKAVCFLVLLFIVEFTEGAFGGEMRIGGRLEDFSSQEFRRSVAILLDCEVSDIFMLGAFPGITVDFQIGDPSLEELQSSSATALTRLEGDKKMLLLYTWWLTNDPHFDSFPYYVISFTVYGEEENGAYIVGQTQTHKSSESVPTALLLTQEIEITNSAHCKQANLYLIPLFMAALLSCL